MALQTSGAISLNDLHAEVGGTTATIVSFNDADIRGLTAASGKTINSTLSTEIDFNDFYGASALPDTIDAKMVNFGNSYIDTTNASADSTGDFNVIDFVVPSALNGQTKRIHIGVKCNGTTSYWHDFAIAGMQILTPGGSPPGNFYSSTVDKAMGIRPSQSEQTWVTQSVQQYAGQPITLVYNTQLGYFQTSGTFSTTTTVGDFGNSLSAVANMTYYNMNSFNLFSSNTFTDGRFNVTGFSHYGTPSLNTGYAGGIAPSTHSNTGSFVQIGSPPINNYTDPAATTGTTQSSTESGHFFFESSNQSAFNQGCVLRSPQHTFSTGEIIRVAYGIATPNSHSFDASDAFFLGVA